MVEYARRFKWHLDFSEMDEISAGQTFQNGLPEKFQEKMATLKCQLQKEMTLEEKIAFLHESMISPHTKCYIPSLPNHHSKLDRGMKKSNMQKNNLHPI